MSARTASFLLFLSIREKGRIVTSILHGIVWNIYPLVESTSTFPTQTSELCFIQSFNPYHPSHTHKPQGIIPPLIIVLILSYFGLYNPPAQRTELLKLVLLLRKKDVICDTMVEARSC